LKPTKCQEAYEKFVKESRKAILCDKLLVFAKFYELTKRFRGRSEFYEIRQCKDLHTHEIRAVKIYRKAELSPLVISMLKRELELLQRLDHPNIIHVYDALEDESKIYFVIDDMRGQNLFDYIISNGKCSEQITASITC